MWSFLKYNDGDSWFYLREFVGPYLALARAPAACLNLNTMLILIPVCRNLLALTRRIVFKIERAFLSLIHLA